MADSNIDRARTEVTSNRDTVFYDAWIVHPGGTTRSWCGYYLTEAEAQTRASEALHEILRQEELDAQQAAHEERWLPGLEPEV